MQGGKGRGGNKPNNYKGKPQNTGKPGAPKKNPISQEKKINDDTLSNMKAQKASFQHLFTKINEELKTADYCYLLSNKFLDQWKNYVDLHNKCTEEQNSKAFLRKKPEKINEDLVQDLGEHIRFPDPESPCSAPIKPEIEQGKDYILVHYDLWAFFKKHYEGIMIKRAFEMKEDEKGNISYTIKEDFQTVTVAFVYGTYLKKLDSGQVKQLKVKQMQVPNDISIKRMRSIMAKIVNKFGVFRYTIDSNSVRLWSQDPKYPDMKTLTEHIIDSCVKSRSYDYQITFEGELLDRKPHEMLKDQIKDQDPIIVEVNEPGKMWIFYNELVKACKKCDFCKTISFLDYSCICGKKFYCSEICKYTDKLDHSKKCPKAFDSDEEKEIEKKYKCIDGLCGLENLGNTCYMNSAIQCLSNIDTIASHFYENKYKQELNLDNPLGTKGKITKKFAYLIKKLWLDENKAFAPYSFKYAMAKNFTIFEGTQQHDPNEFLFFLLDALHEDLNLILKKPYTEAIEDQGFSDDDLATLYWNTFLMRNKSIIVDQMFGLFKSTIQCLKCPNTSRSFETYSVCSLPIPDQQPEVEVFFVFYDYKQKPYRMMMKYPDENYTLSQLEQNIVYMLGLTNPTLQFAMCSTEVFEPIYDKEMTVDQVCKKLQNSYLLMFELGQDEIELIQSTDEWFAAGFKMVKREFKGTISKLGPIRMKILPKNMNGMDLYLEIFTKSRFQFEENWQYKQNITNLNDAECFDAVFEKIGQPFEMWVLNNSSSYMLEYNEKQPFKGRNNKANIILEIIWTVSPDDMKPDWFKAFIKFDPFKQGANKEELIKEKQIMSIHDCLKSFSLPEELGDDNAWYCNKCKTHQPALKNLEIFNTPNILVLHLKRFKGAGNNRWNRTESKITDIIKFPLTDFDVTDYIISKKLPTELGQVYENGVSKPMEKSMDPESGNSEEQKKEEDGLDKRGRVLYDLVGVLHHNGVMNSGHCISHCLHPKTKEWYEFNDDKVIKLTNLEKLITDTAYILFYKRKQ